jgi:hypothetical protein
VETLGEIDHEARKEAAQLGFTQFEMTPGLNNSPTFISALADLVATAVGVNLDEYVIAKNERAVLPMTVTARSALHVGVRPE